MAEERFEIGVVVARRKLRGPWAREAWLPVSALPAAPPAAPWTLISASPDEELLYAGSCEVALHPSDTAHYRDNLASGRPSLWVALRNVGGDEYEIGSATADPYAGEAMAEGIGEIVEAVPMPADVQKRVAAFVDTFHVERAFVKRKRERADPEALGRKGRGRSDGGDLQ